MSECTHPREPVYLGGMWLPVLPCPTCQVEGGALRRLELPFDSGGGQISAMVWEIQETEEKGTYRWLRLPNEPHFPRVQDHP
jgi:hypothetical protein